MLRGSLFAPGARLLCFFALALQMNAMGLNLVSQVNEIGLTARFFVRELAA
jgi:hypothetical protein